MLNWVRDAKVIRDGRLKAVVAAFNQEKALVGAFSVITNLRMELFQALLAAAAHPLVLRHFLQPGELSFTTHPYTRAAEIWQEASTL